MTNVTNIYIDTTGFTDEQYWLADNAMNNLKSSCAEGWAAGEEKPDRATFLFLDRDGDRHFFNTIEAMHEYPLLFDCSEVSLAKLLSMKLCKKHSKPFDPLSIKLMVNDKPVESEGQPITALDSVTPEKERDIVCAVISSLYSARLISVDVYRVIINAMIGYAATNGTQS